MWLPTCYHDFCIVFVCLCDACVQEERFLYPIYPLIAYIAGNTLDHILRILSGLFGAPPPRTPRQKKAGKPGSPAAPWVEVVKSVLLVICMLGGLMLFSARVASNYNNFSGMLLFRLIM